MTVQFIAGDCHLELKKLPDESVNCVVTSPPYWNLRDYNVDGQMGLEKTPDEYISSMVEVFRECRRILKPDGTLWLNLGDSYASPSKNRTPAQATAKSTLSDAGQAQRQILKQNTKVVSGLKKKDLVGIPWAMAFALRADGWYLRQDIIWHKPNPMPESIGDRCTKAHEYIFLLSKSERYFFDAEKIKEPSVSGDARKPYAPGQVDDRGDGHARGGGQMRKVRKPAGWDTGDGAHGTIHRDGRAQEIEYQEVDASIRNKRSVWTVPTFGFKEAHFATFPPDLIIPCILAGCPQGGTVLDPFGGAGTTGLVADRLQRNAILIELNPEYLQIAQRRIQGDAPLFCEVINA